MSKLQLSEAYYNSMVKKFKNRFPLQTEEIDFLEGLYSKYKKQFLSENKQTTTSTKSGVDTSILLSILKSGYSIEEYCAVYGGYTIKSIKKIHTYIKDRDSSLFESIQESCMCSSDLFYVHIRNVIDNMMMIEDFTIFDYFYYTKISPYDFIELSKDMVNSEELKKVNLIIQKIKNQKNLEYGNVSVRLDLDSKTIISGIEITRSIKEKIIEYLEENRIPIIAYRSALRKYAAGDERLTEFVDQNQKVIK